MVKLGNQNGNYIRFDKVYKQTDGLTTGGSVSRILAHFVITDLLDNTIEKSVFEPTLLIKYVDDTLAFLPKEEMENFLTYSMENIVKVKLLYRLKKIRKSQIWTWWYNAPQTWIKRLIDEYDDKKPEKTLKKNF